nr:hypothetical protein Iba_chr06aCG12980 [Ipomoea batatas]
MRVTIGVIIVKIKRQVLFPVSSVRHSSANPSIFSEQPTSEAFRSALIISDLDQSSEKVAGEGVGKVPTKISFSAPSRFVYFAKLLFG